MAIKGGNIPLKKGSEKFRERETETSVTLRTKFS